MPHRQTVLKTLSSHLGYKILLSYMLISALSLLSLFLAGQSLHSIKTEYAHTYGVHGAPEIPQKIEHEVLALYLIVSATLLVTLLLYLFYVRPRIIARVAKLSQQTHDVINGDLLADIDTSGDDELAQMSQSLGNFRQSLIAKEMIEHRIEESQKRLSAILDNTLDGIITIDGLGTIETFNKACEDIFGYNASEVIGHNVKILMPSPDREAHDNYLRNYQRSREAKIIGIGREVHGRRKDGSIFPLDLSVAEVCVDGRTIYSGILRDITTRKQAEEEILRSNIELERFAYIAAHDMQEPLRMVVSFGELLQQNHSDKLDGEANEYLNFCIKGTRQMQDIVNDLLEYAKAGDDEETDLEIDMNETLALTLKNLEDIIRSKGAIIEADNLPIITGHPIRMMRVLQNLIGNALKYQPADQTPIIKIKASASHQKRSNKDGWLFRVSDNGIGIAPAYRTKVFEPFKRLHNHTKYNGTGIGLAICKRILGQMGGAIWVEDSALTGESKATKGSCFCFFVPHEKVAAKEAAPEQDIKHTLKSSGTSGKQQTNQNIKKRK